MRLRLGEVLLGLGVDAGESFGERPVLLERWVGGKQTLHDLAHALDQSDILDHSKQLQARPSSGLVRAEYVAFTA